VARRSEAPESGAPSLAQVAGESGRSAWAAVQVAEAGTSDFVTKPLDPDLLFATLLWALEPGA
jgi:DNA-binding NtrC family response regulator